MANQSGLSFEEQKTLAYLLEKQREGKKALKTGTSGYDMSGKTLVASCPPKSSQAKGSDDSGVKRGAADELEDLSSDWVLDAEAMLEISQVEAAIEEFNRSPPVYLDKSVYMPEGIRNFEEWSKTLITFPSLKSRHLSYQEFYTESIFGSQKDVDELGSFARWVMKRWCSNDNLRKMQKWSPKHQAQDFGHWLMACNWENKVNEAMEARVAKQKVNRFKREFKGLVQ